MIEIFEKLFSIFSVHNGDYEECGPNQVEPL